jgi:hypothetical protein
MGVESKSGWSFKYGDSYGWFFSNSVVMFSQPYVEDIWWNDPLIPTKFGVYTGFLRLVVSPKSHVF